MKNLYLLLGLGLAILVMPLLAEDAKPKKKKGAGKKQTVRPVAAMEKQLAALDLSDDQKKKTDEILAKYNEKFAAVQGKNPLSKEQRQARKEAMDKAKAEGKKGPELKAAVDAAVILTAEQEEAQQKAQAATKELQASLKKDVSEVLTAEQAAKLSSKGKGKGKKKKQDAQAN